MIAALSTRAFRLLRDAPVEGCIAEFGVYQGGSLVTMARLAEKYLGEIPPIYGFDTFTGMPSTAVELSGDFAEGWAEGTFSDTSLQAVQEQLARERIEAHLVQGRFDELDSLDVGRIALAHIDADIYEGYRDALRLVTPHVGVGSVMLFDESIPPTHARSQSVREHGQRAVREWEAESGLNLHLIRFEWTVALCVIVDEQYLDRHWRLIDDLRNDTIRESFWNAAKKVLGRPREARPGSAR